MGVQIFEEQELKGPPDWLSEAGPAFFLKTASQFLKLSVRVMRNVAREPHRKVTSTGVIHWEHRSG